MKSLCSGKEALILLACTTVILPVYAQNSVAGCADIENSEARLACYDEVSVQTQNLPVVRLPRNTVNNSIESSVSSTDANARVIQGDRFGLESNPNDSRIRTYRVVSAKQNDFTGWTIEFDGGGKWRQVGTDSYTIKVGETYSVRRTTLSSYLLSNSSNNRKIRITRLE